MRFASFRLRHSLAAQLLATYLVAVVFTAATILCFVWFGSTQNIATSSQGQLKAVAEIIQRSVQFDSSGVPMLPKGVNSIPADLSWVFRDFAADAKYRILDPSGRVIISSEKDSNALAPLARPFDLKQNSFTMLSNGETLLGRTAPIIHGKERYFIQFAVSQRLASFGRAVSARKLFSDAWQFSLVSVVLFTIVVYLTLRRVLKPLRETSDAAAEIDAYNLTKRLVTRNLPSEFLPVVTAFNLTLDRLEKGYNVQRAFLAGAAHELKTPLALIRAQIEMDGTYGRDVLLRDLDLMARQVNQLLHLAEASETQNYVVESVDVIAVVEDVVDHLGRLAARRQVYLDVRRSPESLVLQADRGAMYMLLKNLLENAIQHSPIGGLVAVTVEIDRITIRDEGPGIADNDLPKLFTRFWRGSTRRDEGAGLGLSICKEIAAAHKWGLAARSTAQGAEFTLSVSS
jgi:two-component system, OmpR family, sensor histidine kinase QseC